MSDIEKRADGTTMPATKVDAGDRRERQDAANNAGGDIPSPHPLASRLISLNLHTLVRCTDTGIEGKGCGSLFLYPSEILADPETDTRCPHCGGWLSSADESEMPASTDFPDQAIPFAIDRQQALDTFREWLSHQHYMPRGTRDIDWVATPVYVAQSWRSWDCAARIAGVTKATKEGSQQNAPAVWTGLVAEGTGRVPMAATPGVSGIGDATIRRLRPFKVVGRITPVRENTIPMMPSNAVLELPRLSPGECASLSRDQARTAFLETLTEKVAMTEVGAEDIHLSEKIDKGGMLSVPVWIVRQRYGDLSFAMNGQDGRIAGEVPIDRGERIRFATTACIVGAIVSVAVAALAWTTPGQGTGNGTTGSPSDAIALAVITLLAMLALTVATVSLIDGSRMRDRERATRCNETPDATVRDLVVTDRRQCGDGSYKMDFAMDDALEAFAKGRAR